MASRHDVAPTGVGYSDVITAWASGKPVESIMNTNTTTPYVDWEKLKWLVSLVWIARRMT